MPSRCHRAVAIDREIGNKRVTTAPSAHQDRVDAKVADAFAAKLAARVRALPAGKPEAGNVVLGSVVGQATVDRIKHLVDDATKQGAVLLAGGGGDGTVMAGIVVDHVTPAMKLFREESFGP